tara:strand:+ start:1120 stop:2895 length:1776 start_codon:yes stop_codon:yes gene_type:complete
MCGILGVFPCVKYSNVKIESFINSLNHRGPDNQDHLFHENLLLAHSRLSIIDIKSNSNQPFSSCDNRYSIVFNGEITNYLSLKVELEKYGVKFRTESDTEVLLNLLIKWGESALEKLDGMFAFAFLDKLQNTLILSRDFLGVKPLYYSLKNNELIFSSEVKSFNKLNVYDKNPNWKELYLTFGFIPDNQTTIDGVYSLPKGSFLKFDLNTHDFVIKSYLQETHDCQINNEIESKNLISQKLIKSVRDNLISDAPLGVFLSGGIDSSLLVLLANLSGQKELRTVSVNFDVDEYNERNYQEIILENINNNKHTDFIVTKDIFFNEINDILNKMDQPSCDGINSYFVSLAAKKAGLKTVLSGVGGDELFGGYPSFKRASFLPLLNSLPNFFLTLLSKFSNYFSRLEFLKIEGNYKEYLFYRGIFNISQISQILEKPRKLVLNTINSLKLNPKNREKLRRVSDLELNIYMQNQLLKDTDCFSMANSLEVRVPFLNKDFIKTLNKINPEIRFAKPGTKSLLISTFQNILPKEIVNRKKSGFVMPFDYWLRSDINKTKSLLGNNPKSDIILDQFINKKIHWSRLWMLIVLNHFETNE